MFQRLLDFFFPRISLTGEEGEWVTPGELRQVRSHPILLRSGELRALGIQSLDRVFAVSPYKVPLLRRAIHTLKYRRIPGIAAALGGMMAETSLWIFTDDGVPVLCPVPLHWTRKFMRGFNQSELLAREVSRLRQWHWAPLLRRIRATGSQAQRSRQERLTALTDAFAVRDPCPAYVLLVDDVFTTGATLDACAKVLKDAGAKRVEGLVLARD